MCNFSVTRFEYVTMVMLNLAIDLLAFTACQRIPRTTKKNRKKGKYFVCTFNTSLCLRTSFSHSPINKSNIIIPFIYRIHVYVGERDLN